MEFLTVKHSYAGGDLITILPGLRNIYNKTGQKWVIYQQIDFELFYYDGMIPATVDSAGRSVSMNRKHFEMLKSLLLAQDYIEDFREWKGEKVYIDIDKSRDSRTIPIPYSPLHYWAFFIAPELQCDLSIKWLSVSPVTEHSCSNKIIINRTQRYNNPYINYFFLKQYESDLIFSGTKTEHELFCKQWDLDVPYLDVANFYELLQAIDACRFTICNQSLFYHLCDAIKKPRILEVCSQFPNTFPTGSGGFAFVYQESLELYVHKLFNT